MAAKAEAHELWIALSGLFPDTVEPLRAIFDGLVPQERVVVWTAPGAVAHLDPPNRWRIMTGELVREAFLAQLRPDVIHISSLFEGLGDDTLTSINSLANVSPTAVTLYDLIPLIHPDAHLKEPVVAAWYQRKVEHLRRADLWLAISECSRRDGIDRLSLPEEWVVNIGAAADGIFRPMNYSPDEQETLRRRHGLLQPFVMCTGVIEQRKNIEGLISAYARLPSNVRARHQLAVVSKANAEQIEGLTRLARQCGLQREELVLTGFVPDSDLVALYNLCEVFVFPSWHEGFGLPALEAMSCGAATIGANTSSVPEVIGRDDALFDPQNVDDIAAKLCSVLTDKAFRQDLRRHAVQQAKNFSWAKTARHAIDAFERLDRHRQVASVARIAMSNDCRPRLAYISPLPPERSGIADYSAELLPELARHYDIEVIVNQSRVDDPWIRANVPIRDVSWFDQNADRYDRVLYHFGNSTYHQHMFGLLERHRGIVVLHDFFLGNVIAHMDGVGYAPGFWDTALYASHGYHAVQERILAQEPSDIAWKYPVNLAILQQADGVIVHSEFARKLADLWYGDRYSLDWSKIPLLRAQREGPTRADARKALGLHDRDFLVCCFGMMGPTKLNLRLIDAWLGSALAADDKCRLVFVGEKDNGKYGAECSAALSKNSDANRIRSTGFVAPSSYRNYLAAADIAVQLRALSRGETSASVLECMSYGLPTIVNALGAATELPADCIFRLPDPFSSEQLVAALELLWKDPSLRLAIGERARAYVRSTHSPRAAADQYAVAIERFNRTGSRACIARLSDGIAQVDAARPEAETEWLKLAQCVRQNELSFRHGPRQWLVDISALVRHDPKSGIQRVVRTAMLEWLSDPPSGFRVEPIFCDGDGIYRYARRFSAELLQLPASTLVDEPIETRSGDVFVAVDLFLQLTPERRAVYAGFRLRGVRLYFVVYDLLPVLRPEFFPDDVDDYFRNWLLLIAEFADGAVCISRTVADELTQWLGSARIPRERPMNIGWFHLGANIDARLTEHSVDPGFDKRLGPLRERPSILMVGTIEPRKGVEQALDAFESLWEAGLQVNLVIAGKVGWSVELPVIKKLRAHPEIGRRLFWFDSAGDEELLRLYETVSGLLMASEGEGFGLPLIEAAQHKVPILARDIPVFREVAGVHASYFSGLSPDSLAEAMKKWLAALGDMSAPNSAGMHYQTWRESVQQLTEIILEGRWHAQWLPQKPERGSSEAKVDGTEKQAMANQIGALSQQDPWHATLALGPDANGVGSAPAPKQFLNEARTPTAFNSPSPRNSGAATPDSALLRPATSISLDSFLHLIYGSNAKLTENVWQTVRGSLGKDVVENMSDIRNVIMTLDRQSFPTPLDVRFTAADLGSAQINGISCPVDRHDASVSGPSAITGFWEPHLVACFRRICQRGSIAFDIGANVGYHTLMLAQLVGAEGMCYAFEPNSENCRLILLGVEQNQFANVKLMPIALSDRPGWAYFSRHVGSNGGFATRDAELGDGRGVVVPVFMLDDLQLPPPDLIKVDVEGAEYRVLKGAEKSIGRGRPIIISEFSLEMTSRVSGVPGAQYLEWIAALEYDIFLLDRVTSQLVSIPSVPSFLAGWGSHIRIEDLLFVPREKSHLIAGN